MRNFSAAYKKRFKQMLSPHGYINKKSYFYKLEGDVFFIIGAKGKFTGERGAIWTFISPSPYCIDRAYDPEDFNLRDLVDNMFLILQRIDPNKYTLEYYTNLIRSTSDDDILRSLDNVCEVIEDVVLPYIHRFTDLGYFYNEIQMLNDSNIVNPPIGVTDDELFWLSIKLRKYENALIHLDNQIEDYRNRIKRMRAEIDESRKNEWHYKIDESETEISRTSRDRKIILESHELYRTSREHAIIVDENKINQLQGIKKIVLAKDYSYLDNYIKEIETRSRACLLDM